MGIPLRFPHCDSRVLHAPKMSDPGHSVSRRWMSRTRLTGRAPDCWEALSTSPDAHARSSTSRRATPRTEPAPDALGFARRMRVKGSGSASVRVTMSDTQIGSARSAARTGAGIIRRRPPDDLSWQKLSAPVRLPAAPMSATSSQGRAWTAARFSRGTSCNSITGWDVAGMAIPRWRRSSARAAWSGSRLKSLSVIWSVRTAIASARICALLSRGNASPSCPLSEEASSA